MTVAFRPRVILGTTAGVVGLVLLVGSCGPLSSDTRQHRRAVADLTAASDAEDGWLVLELPNHHEGGGTTMWWLHPCDPEVDRVRDVTMTGFHGTDTFIFPLSAGLHTVSTASVPCLEPGPHIDLDAGRKVKLDADVVLLTGGMIALLEPREVVVVRDVDHDSEHRIERGSGHIDGPCDGRTAWTGRLQSPVELSFSVFGCVDRFAAVPAEAVAMLVPPGQRSIDETTVAELSAGEVVAFDAALTRAGWEATTNDYSRAHRRFSDGSGGMSRYYWFGPCGPAHDQDRNTQTEIMWHDGEVIVSKRPCE